MPNTGNGVRYLLCDTLLHDFGYKFLVPSDTKPETMDDLQWNTRILIDTVAKGPYYDPCPVYSACCEMVNWSPTNPRLSTTLQELAEMSQHIRSLFPNTMEGAEAALEAYFVFSKLYETYFSLNPRAEPAFQEIFFKLIEEKNTFKVEDFLAMWIAHSDYIFNEADRSPLSVAAPTNRASSHIFYGFNPHDSL